MMRDILTGGACNVNGESSSQVNQNPFNRLMGSLFMGNAQNQDRLQGFRSDGQQGDMMKNALQERAQMMQIMNQKFDMINKEEMANQQVMDQHFNQQQMLMHQQNLQMEQAFMQQQQMMHHENMMMEQMMQEQFKQQQALQIQQMQEQEKLMSQQFDSLKLQQEAEEYAQQLMMENEMENVELEQQKIKHDAGELFDKMAKDDSPRMKNSKFLHFMGHLKSGQLKIEGNEIVEGVPDQDQKDIDAIFNKAYENAMEEQKQSENNDAFNLEQFWQSKIQEYEKERQDEEGFEEKLDKEYQDVLKYMQESGDYEELSKAWQKASDLEEQSLYKDASDRYAFSNANPYLTHENPLHLALEFIASGRPFDAILALEAQIQKNPDAPSSANTWRLMGRLHQEMDQDQRAVACLLNALKKDDTNPDTFLALGVSCTNILDEVKAMGFLKQWYLISDMQKAFPISADIVPDDKVYSEFSTEDIKNINKNMLDAFYAARNQFPQNPDLHVCLAVLQYISRDYQGSVESFREALKYDPSNYSLWNKLGATLAQLGKADEAIHAYYRALELKPNYVRVWVNLGIAHAYKQDYSEAARLYLNALSFNPEAKHLWSYLQTCFMCLQRFDLVGKISDHNPALFADEFEILKFDDLPQPEFNYQEATKKYLISENEINQMVSEQLNKK
ncbi:hypothetical protein ABPG74_007530 [Tetrahymena malaccensis]